MKKEYAVNIKSVNSDSDWNTADMADWYESYSEAYDTAEKTFEDRSYFSFLTLQESVRVSRKPCHTILYMFPRRLYHLFWP